MQYLFNFMLYIHRNDNKLTEIILFNILQVIHLLQYCSGELTCFGNGIKLKASEWFILLTVGSFGPFFFASSSVQHECIPQAILGMDVICQAKSGMGKTAVFVLSTLQQIDPVPGQVSALVLCHTRELAYQVFIGASD